MWDLAFVGIDRTAFEAARPVSEAAARLVAHAEPSAHVLLLTTAGGGTTAEALAGRIEDLGRRADVVPLRPDGAIADAAVERAVTGLLDEALRPVVVDGLASARVALLVELLVGALRLRSGDRLTYDVERGAVVDAGGAASVGRPAEREFLGALRAVDDLLAGEQLVQARALLAAIEDVALATGDPVAVTLPATREVVELAIACRTVPAPGADRLLLGSMLRRQPHGSASAALAAALLEGDGRVGAGVLAIHALDAALARGEDERVRALARISASFAEVDLEPSTTLSTRARAALPEFAELLSPSSDVAAAQVAAARRMLRDTEVGQALGARAHALVLPTGDGTADVDGLQRLERWDDVLVAGPRPATVLSVGPPVHALVEGAPPVIESDLLRSAISGPIVAGDAVTVVGGASVDAAERVAAVVCVEARARVTEVLTHPHPDVRRRTSIDAVIAPARRSAVAQVLARRTVARGSWRATVALDAHVRGTVAAGALGLARRLAAGDPPPSDVEELRRLGVDDVLVERLASRAGLAAPVRRALARWPEIRQGLRDGRPHAAPALAALLESAGSPHAAAVAAELQAAHERVADASAADVARGLGVVGAVAVDRDELVAAVEEAVAVELGVPGDLLGGPDPAAAVLMTVDDRPLLPVRRPVAAVALPSDLERPPDVDLLADTSEAVAGETGRDDLLAFALAELRVEAHPEGPWAVDAALAATALADGAGLDRTSEHPLATLASRRAAAAVERLLAVPSAVQQRAGSALRGDLHDELRPLQRWLGGLPEGDALEDWLSAWPAGAPDAAEAYRGVDALVTMPSGPRSVPVSAALSDRGLVEDGAKLELRADPAVPERLQAELALRPAVAAAFRAAVDAWAAFSADDRPGGAADELERALGLLRAVARGAALTDAGPALPDARVRLFDADAEELVVDQPLLLTAGDHLHATVPQLAAGLRVDVGAGGSATARDALADALCVRRTLRAMAAEELRVLGDQYDDPAARRALRRTALVLAEGAAESAGLLAHVRAAVEADGHAWRPPRGLELDTLGARLLELIAEERDIAANELAWALSPASFADLDERGRRDRLAKYRSGTQLLGELDAFLP